MANFRIKCLLKIEEVLVVINNSNKAWKATILFKIINECAQNIDGILKYSGATNFAICSIVDIFLLIF